MIRIGALYSHPIQYFTPLFRELASRSSIDLTVLFCTDQGLTDSLDPDFGRVFRWDVPLLDGYRCRFLRNWTRQHQTDGFWQLINPQIVTELVRGKFDVLLMHGYEHATKLIALAASVLTGTPILLRGDSNLLHPRGSLRRATKDVLLRRLLRLTAACLYVGRHNREYYRHYGVPEAKLHFTPYCVDNAAWQQRRTASLGMREAVRRRWSVPADAPVILYVGKLIPKKQPLLLLDAFARIRANQPCALVYAGDGALRNAIEDRARVERIPDVHVLGFLNQGELAPVYNAADVCVLPSAIEPWGLAVNEAMNFALPVVITNRVGCEGDLVRDGENGFVVAHDCVSELAAALQRLTADADLRAAFGRRSAAIVAEWSVAACVDGIIRAAEHVVQQRG